MASETTLGLDLGSNSVGSAWIDLGTYSITVGTSIFPQGVEVSENKRGAPKNQKRRATRSQRKSIARRAERKRRLRKLLISSGLLPSDAKAFDKLMQRDPWRLRQVALDHPVTPHEFGRILYHLNQRRGALGIEFEEDENGESKKKKSGKGAEDTEEGEVRKALLHTREVIQGRTFGQMMAEKRNERKHSLPGKPGKYWHGPIRNRAGKFEFHADRALVHEEFQRLWDAQTSFKSDLAEFLTDDLRRKFDDPDTDDTWRHKGELFGQRRTYWDAGTLGHCDLEPSDHGCPLCDMHAQEFRVIESVNNIRFDDGSGIERVLSPEERDEVIRALRSQKTGSPATIRKALGIDKRSLKKRDEPDTYSLNVERDPDREINTDWFYREIVLGVFGEERWEGMKGSERESVNRALQKFDPADGKDAGRLREGAGKWWKLDEEKTEALLEAWGKRPKPQKRLKLSRRAIRNLLPYMRRADGPTVTQARQLFAEDTNNDATAYQRARYAFHLTEEFKDFLGQLAGKEAAARALKARNLTKAGRHFSTKHPNTLPPPPMLANPVARKTVYEVRRHLNEYLRRFGKQPDRVVIEFAREAIQPAHVRNKQLSANRAREKERKIIIEEFGLADRSHNQQNKAIERVLLCREQRNVCAYTGRTITPAQAAAGVGENAGYLEVDHIVPKSRTNENGFNNKVLCYESANRDKGNRTVKEWLSADRFEQLEQRLRHLSGKKGTQHGVRPNPRKWKNLHRNAPDVETFANSQLSDTAYAAREVANYLRGALYGGETEGKRRVFVTKGRYTATLRRDWGLVESEIDRAWHGSAEDPDMPGTARKSEKNRCDHRHHAIDAVAIALTDSKRILDLARFAAEQEDARAGLGKWPKRKELPPPWGTKEEFRAQVLEAVDNLIVCHRPVKRRIVEGLHTENPFGKASEYPGLYTFRIPARPPQQGAHLKPSSLEEPKPRKKDKDGKVTEYGIAGKGQNSVVRNPALREAIRECLLRNKKDPEKFTKQDLKELTDPDDYKFRWPDGTPIYKIQMVRTLGKPVRIVRENKDGVERFYQGENNHHMEILEDTKTGKWSGICWKAFDVARRVRPPRGKPRLPMVIGRKLEALREAGDMDEKLLALYDDESLPKHYRGKKFVMSLAMGETIYMRDPDTGRPDYFVVVKTSGSTVHFVRHSDARPTKKNEKGEERKLISKSVQQLKELGPESGKPPVKVRVSPLGVIERLAND